MLVIALATVVFVVPLAGANGPMGGTETVSVTVPAGGTASVTRSPMPASSTTGTVGVTAKSDDADFFANLTAVLTSLPTRKSRVLGCIALNANVADAAYGNSENFEVDARTLQLLFLSACLRVALDMKQVAAARHGALAHAATATKCSNQPISVAIHITKTAHGYKATVSGTTSKPKKMAFRVSCKKTAKSLQAMVTSMTLGGKLAKAIGPILSVGFASSSASSGKLKIALGVR